MVLGRREAAEELDRLIGGRNAELIVQGEYAAAVLTAHELLLMLCGVAAHEQSVNGFTA